jgi:RHS repeat-associated protein
MRNRTLSLVITLVASLLASATAFAQAVTYIDDFQSYGTQKKPTGWVDTPVGSTKPVSKDIFTTWPDPLQSSKGTNIVYGAKQSSEDGEDEGNGTFSTLTTKTFSGTTHFEYRGRMLRTNSSSHLGLTFFSAYPQKDQYYLIGLQPHSGRRRSSDAVVQPNDDGGGGDEGDHGDDDDHDTTISMQLVANGAGTPTGTLDSKVTIATNKWYRFAIIVDPSGSAIRIRARFWLDGATEPSTWSIDAIDSSSKRLTSGRIGVWAAVKSNVYFDDFNAQSSPSGPPDTTPPTIQFFESGNVLADNAIFSRTVTPEIRVTDSGSGVATAVAKLDQNPYTSLSPVSDERLHQLDVDATDKAGNTAHATVHFYVDKSSPVISILEDGVALPNGATFNRNVTPVVQITDLTPTTSTITLDGKTFVSGTTVTAPGSHTLAVQATDSATHTATQTVTFTIDKSGPALTITSPKNGDVLGDPKVTVTGSSATAVSVTVNGIAATINTAAKTYSASLTLVEGTNTITVTGKDSGGNPGTATITVSVDTLPPQILITSPTAACISDSPVVIGGTVSDPHLQSVSVQTGGTSVAATIVAASGTWSASIPSVPEGKATFVATATDTLGHSKSATLSVTIDRTKPVVDLTQNGVSFTATYAKDSVTLAVVVTDANDPKPTVTVTLDGAAYVPATAITQEGPHTVDAIATNCSGLVGEKKISFTIDRTAPSILFYESGNVLSDNAIFNRNAIPEIRVTDSGSGVSTVVAKLDQNPYTSLTPVSDEKLHQLDVDATDKAGNTSHATVHFYVDKSAPVISILEAGVALPNGATFNRNVTPVVQITDLTPTTSTITLDGQPFASGTTVSASGSHTLNVQASDSATHSTTATVTFTIDKSGPALTITSPKNGDVLADPRVTVTGSAATAVSVTVNGVAATIDAAAKTYSASLTLAEGDNTIVVAGKDSGGNPGTATITVSIDTLAPRIVITSPTGACVNDSPVVIGGTVSDPHLQGVVVQVGGTTVAATIVAAGGTWSASIPNVPEGKATFTATATDTVGHSNSATLSLTIDRTAPIVDLTRNGASFIDAYAKGSVTLTVVVTDANDPKPAMSVTLDGAAYVSGTAITTEGPHTVDAIATNCSGLVGEKKVQFTIDRTPPSIQITESNNPVTDNQIFSRDAVPQINVTDSGSGVGTVAAKLDNNAYTSGTPVTSEGLHQLDVDASDKAGNAAHATVHFYVDKSAPVILILEGGVALPTGATFNRTVVPVVQITDVTPITATITLDGQPFASGTTVSAPGSHTLAVQATDSATHTATATVTFTIDKSGPALTITSPKNGDVLGDPHVMVTGSSATAVSVTVNGVAAAIDAAAKTYSASLTLVEGANTIVVSGSDSGGNPGTATITVSIDTVSPQIAITSPNAACISDSPVVIGGTVSDAHLQGVSVQVGGTTVAATIVPASGTWSASIPNVPEGNATFVATATDAAGHTGSATSSLTIDRTAPVVDLTQNGASFTDAFTRDSVTLTVIVTDANDPKPSLTVTLDNAVYVPGTAITQEGPHTVDAIATNCAGLVGEKKISFTIDRTPPSIQFTESGSTLTDNQVFSRDAVPQITATDSASGVGTVAAKLDNIAYTSGTPVTSEGLHQLDVDATDKAGNTAHATVHFYVSKSAPVIIISESGAQLVNGTIFKRDVTPVITATGTTTVTVTALLNNAPFASGTTITTNGTHTLAVQATDLASRTSMATVSFTIDKTVPVLTITSPKNSDVLTNPHVTVTGAAADIAAVTVNGVSASVDAVARTYSASLSLVEGTNTITASGRDASGNPLSASVTVSIDTRAPQLAIVSPAAGACLNTASVDIHGTVSDLHLQGVSVQFAGASTAATVDSATGNWVATIANVPEGKVVFIVTATDTVAHSATSTLSLTIDRTAPVVSITEGGTPFTATLLNRLVTLSVRATDLDPNVQLAITLDNAAYVPGTAISQDGARTLDAIATNCAGLKTEKKVSFTIDRTPPALSAFTPADGSTVGSAPTSIHGTSSKAATITVAGTSATTTIAAAGTFDITGVTFIEGLNRFTLHAVDLAGNSSDVSYSFTLRTVTPAIDVLDNGVSIPNGAIFNRSVTPVIKASAADATISAQLNQQPFASGTTITANGSYTISATATDPVGHSASTTVAFTIDTSAPAVAITSPANGQVIDADHVTVTGTAGNSVSLTVNGQSVPLAADGSFSTTVALDFGETPIIAVGRNRAGNSGNAQIVVSRAATGTGVILTSPADASMTNRPTTVVTGRILTPANAQTLSLQGAMGSQTTATMTVPSDPAGSFVVPDFKLVEGVNAITATLTSTNGKTESATVHVTVDLTPPTVGILAQTTGNAQPLDDNAHFPAAITLSVSASDLPAGNPAPTVTVLLDGAAATLPTAVSANGSHTVVVTATDTAGNQTRVKRNFSIGAQATAGCGLSGFDPADGSIVAASTVTIAGQTGGAAGVKINGIPARIANGSFAGTVELTTEGANSVSIVCTDAAGNTTGAASTLNLIRVTNTPSVTIDSPTEMSVFGTPSVAVSGTIGAGVTAVDVNGAHATITGSTYTAPAIPLSGPLTMLVAHATNAAGRMATASRRVVYLKDPPSLSINWPSDGFTTGTSATDVSGTYINVTPASIQASVSGGTLETHAWSDSTGSFVIHNVPLVPGSQQISVSGHDLLNRNATAAVNVTLSSGAPSIAIVSPANNSYAPAASVAVSGTFATSAAGAQIDVGGTPATAATGNTFSGSATLGASGSTAVVARITQPDGASAIATAFVTQLSDAPSVKQVFPTAEATSVDPGVIVLVSFSAPMDRASLNDGFALLDGSGAPVTGQLRLDRDVVSFAPAATLTSGQRYTIDIRTTAKDLAGNALATEVKSSFTIATTAPASAPTVDAITSPVCGNQLTISGTATASAQVEIDLGGVPQFVTADASGHFSRTIAIPSQPGFRVARVRILGADGSYSPAAEATFQVGCGTTTGSGTQVIGATYDRTANTITVTFSAAIDITTATVGPSGTIQLQLTDGTPVTGTVAGSAGVPPAVIVITPGTPDPRAQTLTLTIWTGVKDATGQPLGSTFSTTFTVSGTAPNDGSGYISGQILDATNGRPLAGTTITTAIPTLALRSPVILSRQSRGGGGAAGAAADGEGSQASQHSQRSEGAKANTNGRSAGFQPAGPPASSRRVSTNSTAANTVVTNAAGQYTAFVPEGAYTIHAYANGYTDVWRQVVVPAGTGIIPIDIRLGARGTTATAAGSDLHLTHGGDTTVTRKATLTVPSASIPTGTSVTLTAVGTQSLAGLLPLGWSPIASAEVHVGAPSGTTIANAGAQLAFDVPAADIAAAARTLTAVEYDSARDQWRVIQPVVSITGTSATININLPSAVGAYALVYPDAPGIAGILPAPPAPVSGGILAGVTDPCLTTTCAPLTANALNLNPQVVLPSDRSVATLIMNATVASSGPTNLYPSGTAVQAYINEELRLVDGTVAGNQPFSADLILYRTLAGDTATADFHIAPSADAARLQLQTGFEHLQVFPYPGRLDRGTLVGPAGGHVPSDETVQVDIPSGATPSALHATATSMKKSDLPTGIAGFDVLAGFNLTLDSVNAGNAGVPPAVTLLKSAVATFTVDATALGPLGNAAQLIVAEVLPSTTYGRIIHLAGTMNAPQGIDATAQVRITSAPVDPSKLPVDGIVRAGQYLLLLAKQPIAYAFGGVRLGATGPYANGASILSSAPGSAGVPPALGVTDVSRVTGLFAIPVVAKPAAPFALTPSLPVTGDGATTTAAASPDPGAFVAVGDLLLVSQPPVLQHVNVIGASGTLDLVASNGAQNVSLATTVQALFSQTIDPSSVNASSITVFNSGTGQSVAGNTTASGSTLTWTAGSTTPFAPNSTYIITIASTMRGSHGAPLGTSSRFTFSTVTVITNSQIHPEKIHITIPDANGVATISGDPGAFPTVPPEVKAWRAIALRRGTAFRTQYQVTSANDGSFSFTIGNCGGTTPCADAVSLTDHIDLEILNAADNIAAILPLGPFASADGQAVVAQPTEDTIFTTRDGVTIHVVPGSFDQPTVIRAARLTDATPFAGVPNFSTELNYNGGVQLDFDCSAAQPSSDPNAGAPPCEAKNRLDVSIPVPAGFDPTGKTLLLGWLGDSIRGPRIMVVDTLRVDGGNFTTAFPSAQARVAIASSSTTSARKGVNAVLTGNDVKRFLIGVTRSGIYNTIDLRIPIGAGVGFAVMDGLQGNYDLFWDQFSSLYASHLYLAESHGRVVIPILTNVKFNLVGVDAGTGLQAFTKAYDPIPIGDPGVGFFVPAPSAAKIGPYPVFGLPFRIETTVVSGDPSPDTPIHNTSIRNFDIVVAGANSISAKIDAALPADPNVDVSLLDVDAGSFSPKRASDDPTRISVPGTNGQRIVLMVGQKDITPDTPLQIVFDRPIYTGGTTDETKINAYFQGIVGFQKVPKPSSTTVPATWPTTPAVLPGAYFRVDSQGRRLNIDMPGPLEPGAIYRINIAKIGGDSGGASGPDLTVGQILSSPAQDAIWLTFQVRDVGGPLTTFKIRQDASTTIGSIRDFALNGNVLFVSAGAGGILAYDIADPGSLTDASVPLGLVQPNAAEYWGVASDQHGRVYATGLGNVFGFLQSYRLEDFVGDGSVGTAPRKIAAPRSAAIVSWTPGYSSGADLGSDTVLSDRPEGIPRKLQLAEQDTDLTYQGLTAFTTGLMVRGGTSNPTTTMGDFTKMLVQIPIEPGSAYATQRITIVNTTLNMRWSADATAGSPWNSMSGATSIGGQPAIIDNVIARANDELHIIYNERTWATVTIFGYGVGIFDVNAMESNHLPNLPPGYQSISERIRITRAGLPTSSYLDPTSCPDIPPNPKAIQDLSLSPETAVISRDADASSSTAAHLSVYGTDVHRGVLDLNIDPTKVAVPGGGPLCDDRSPTGLVLLPTSPTDPTAPGNPRILALQNAFAAASSGQKPFGRFNGAQPYHWELAAADNKPLVPPATPGASTPGQRGSTSGQKVVRDYLLVPGYQYGLLVIDTTFPASGWLQNENLADIIWIPAAAVAVRPVPRTNLATVVDSEGRVLVVDLSNIDQRRDAQGVALDASLLFPRTLAALQGASSSNFGGFGAPDPRILWTSAPGTVKGSLAPVFDPDTGLLYGGDLQGNTATVVAVSDPHVVMKVNLGTTTSTGTGTGTGTATTTGKGITAVSGVVPLGIDPPKDALAAGDANASLAAFRLELTLPGGISVTGGKVRLAVESERVVGAQNTEQTPTPFLPSHLRQKDAAGAADPRASEADGFVMTRSIPTEMEQVLRRQKGFNKFTSPWIIAIADPRASERFTVPMSTTKADAGCASCTRPTSLQGKKESDGVYELWTSGRAIIVRPEKDLFTGKYAYLSSNSRVTQRFSTVMARTVRPTEALVPAQNAPVADGMLQDTTYLHSGEVETSDVDLDAGGRSGMNVVVARTYRSRTLSGTPLGEGWDSPMFRFLLLVPDKNQTADKQNIEYHDGAGEVWLFKAKGTSGADAGSYDSPPGLFLKLQRTTTGWTLLDQKWRYAKFDTLGRLESEGDEFTTSDGADNGNVIRYLYDANGRLVTMIDPVGRQTKLSYYTGTETAPAPTAPAGLLYQVKDWRDRTVTYIYDVYGRLKSAKLPQVDNAFVSNSTVFSGGQPEVQYTYKSLTAPAWPPPSAAGTLSSQPWTDFVELSNLLTVKEPAEVAKSSGAPRVTFTYDETPTAGQRDRVKTQTWPASVDAAAPPAATLTYGGISPDNVSTVDVLGQQRDYVLSGAALYDKRRHLADRIEKAVPTVTGNPILPAPVTLTPQSTDVETKFTYTDQGQLHQVTHVNDGRQDTFTYVDAHGGAAGKVLQTIVTDLAPMSATAVLPEGTLTTTFTYDTDPNHQNTSNTVTKISKQDSVTNSTPRDAQSPSRGQMETSQTDTSTFSTPVTRTNKFDIRGRLTEMNSTKSAGGDTSSAPKTEVSTYQYYGSDPGDQPATIPLLRGELAKSHTGNSSETDGSVDGTYDHERYPGTNGGGVHSTVKDPIRNITTEVWFDARDLMIHKTVKSNMGLTTLLDEKFGYDASGRLVFHSRVQSPLPTEVKETTTYDALGRAVTTSIDNARVNDSSTIVQTKTIYDLAGHKLTSFDPYVSSPAIQSVTTIDNLGRPVSSDRSAVFSTVTPAPTVSSVTAYDVRGVVAFQSDTHRTAMWRQTDVFGRELVRILADGSNTHAVWNGWGQLLESTVSGPSSVRAHSKLFYTGKGRLETTNEEIGPAKARQAWSRFDDGTAVTSLRVAQSPSVDTSVPNMALTYRIKQTTRDTAGRVRHDYTAELPGTTGTITPDDPIQKPGVWSQTDYQTYVGSVPQQMITREPQVGDVAFTTIHEYDGLDRLHVLHAPGGYTTTVEHDEAGNPTSTTRPGMLPETAQFDSRGLAYQRTLPSAPPDTPPQQKSTFDARGVLTTFTDEEGKVTTYKTDDLDRVVEIDYPDSTSEKMEYEQATGVLLARKDRADQWLAYVYDDAGRVLEIHSGDPALGTTGPLLVQYVYDNAGRVSLVKNKDAAVEYADYDLLGRPHTTRTYRFGGGTGLADTGVSSPAITLADVHTQKHDWDVYDERTQWTMPQPGTSTTVVDDGTSPWLVTINQAFDGGGNLKQQSHGVAVGGVLTGTALADSVGRSPGRISKRHRYNSPTNPLTTTFGFSDQLSAPSSIEPLPTPVGSTPASASPASGMLAYSVTSSGDSPSAPVRGGSVNSRNATARLESVMDQASARFSFWDYDVRGRLARTLLSVPSFTASPTLDDMSQATFHKSRTTPPSFFTPAQHAALGTANSLLFEPPSWTALPDEAHQTKQRTLLLDGSAAAVRNYTLAGGRRTGDGVWNVTYDEFGRVTAMEQATDPSVPVLRRVEFAYDPNSRIVGRKALRSTGPGAWTAEDRSNILAADGLPADATFVWDPMADHLVSVFAAGASTPVGAPATAGLIRQNLYGDQEYDDLTEVRIASVPAGTPARFFPIIDHAGTGSLQAVAGVSGDVIERVLYGDSYGDAPHYLQGPVVDKMTFTATTDASGAASSVNVRVHLSEQIDASTLASGVRLASVKSDRSAAFVITAAPTLDDKRTLLWTLSSGDWTSLTTAPGAASIEIDVTSALRGASWGNASVMPPPAWRLQLSSGDDTTSAYPVIHRESISQLTTMIAAIGPNNTMSQTLYEVPTLYMAGSTTSATKLLTAFQMAPFIEPANGMAFFRARWLDPATGTWLSPDPLGYKDSSNLYSFAGGDPVNGRDPTGKCWDLTDPKCRQEWSDTASEFWKLTVTDQRAADRNAEHIVGALEGLKETAVAVKDLAADLTVKNFTDKKGAGDRNLARLQGLQKFAAHPIDTVVTAHKRAANEIIAREQAGDTFGAGSAAAKIGSADAAAVLGGGQLAVALGRAAGNLAATVALRGVSFGSWDSYSVAQGLIDTEDSLSGNLLEESVPAAPAAPLVAAFPRAISAIAQRIGAGHAFAKHVILRGEFPGITTTDELASLTEDVMTNYTNMRQLSGGRAAYYDSTRNIIVIENPAAADAGTVFRPGHSPATPGGSAAAGTAYFNGLH